MKVEIGETVKFDLISTAGSIQSDLAITDLVITETLLYRTLFKALSGQMLKRTLLYPWAEAATVGTSPLILRGGGDWGVGFAAGRRGGTQQKTQSFYQRLAGHAPSARYRCVSTMKGIVLPSSISFKWEGGLWCMKRGWGCC